jgi:hypothetical protein
MILLFVGVIVIGILVRFKVYVVHSVVTHLRPYKRFNVYRLVRTHFDCTLVKNAIICIESACRLRHSRNFVYLFPLLNNHFSLYR